VTVSLVWAFFPTVVYTRGQRGKIFDNSTVETYTVTMRVQQKRASANNINIIKN